MRNPERLNFIVIQCLAALFWGIPEDFQKVFKVSILLFLFIWIVTYYLKGLIKLYNLFLSLGGIVLLVVGMRLGGGFQTSIVNIALSFMIIPLVPYIAKPFTERQKYLARVWCYVWILCLTLQFIFYSFTVRSDRFQIGYEINWGGAYLFLFFLYCDYIKSKPGKIFSCMASLLILSRLFILSLLTFFVVKYIVKTLKPSFRGKWFLTLIIAYSAFFMFNGYYLSSNDFVLGSNDSSRLTELNDESNKLRFLINMTVLSNIGEDDSLWFGYGAIASEDSNTKFVQHYLLMPHNELLDSIAEFGVIFTLYAFIFSGLYYRKLFIPKNFCYLIPIILFTLILWARFLIVPSLEMFFILNLLTCRKFDITISSK